MLVSVVRKLSMMHSFGTLPLFTRQLFSPSVMCHCRNDLWANTILQSSHLNCPKWIPLMWSLRTSLLLYVFGQRSHCTRWGGGGGLDSFSCLMRHVLWLKCLTCILRVAKVFLQCLHLNCSKWIPRIWKINVLLWEKILGQQGQWYLESFGSFWMSFRSMFSADFRLSSSTRSSHLSRLTVHSRMSIKSCSGINGSSSMIISSFSSLTMDLSWKTQVRNQYRYVVNYLL